eukprot:NODE_4210_length_487_cov_80.095890_g3606_i0.p1 GENE.NODE_4210_length_487_cov_80.095890_g3606_i0~~NODE_4210_length_487_cov_80.095890_g3606_i0.p1  ORF type:complete len:121 (-),score=28.76 NODE_4210_length_487_cov_80.095890_g3606_i0:93-455(-)
MGKGFAVRMVDRINQYIRDFKAETRCPLLRLDHIKNYATVQYDLDGASGKPHLIKLLTFVTARPSKARFEATVRQLPGKPDAYSIARISSFSKEDKTICEPYAKNLGMDAFFCVCPRHDV